MRRARAGLCALAAVATVACVEKGPSKKKVDPAYIESNILEEEPEEIENRVEADLGGKVVYLGNDVDTVNLTPGGKARVVHYWKVAEPPGSGWRVFAHVLGAKDSDWMNVDYTDMRAGHPPSKWKAGQIIRDEQKFALDKKWTSPYAQLAVGLYRKGAGGVDGRMPVVSGPSDDEHRVKAFRFEVDLGDGAGGEASSESDRYVVRRASGAIEVDGRAEEESWKEAARSPAFTVAEGGKSIDGDTHARLLWDDEHLYAFVEVEDGDVYSPYTDRDATLWKADCVELFIDADGNRRGYVELQVNPRNALFDAWFPKTRSQKHHFDWNSDMETAVVVRGSADEEGGGDEGWSVEIAIPLEDVKGMDEDMDVEIPPQVGDSWKLNVVRVEKPKGAKSVTAASWNPITIQDFHALSRMLTVVFADEEGKTEAEETEAEETEAEEKEGAKKDEEEGGGDGKE